MPAELVNEIDSQLALMQKHLVGLQNQDGGFKGFYCHDVSSGLWTTAEIVHNCAKANLPVDDLWLRKGCEYIAGWQNADGGWPFRAKGKSITDITAWCCLALSHFGYRDQINKGIEFLLSARGDTEQENEEGWGLTTFETNRILSTWMASYSLSRLTRDQSLVTDVSALENITGALAKARQWLLDVRRPDGSWGPSRNETPSHTSTAAALLTLFLQGENPVHFRSSCEYLRRGARKGFWSPETDIVVTREGYELNQQWFTTTYCFRAMVFFAELEVASIPELDAACRQLLNLIAQDGGVAIMPGGPADMVWPIPLMIEALSKYKDFVLQHPRQFRAFIESKQEGILKAKKLVMEERLLHLFPFPISQVFFTFQHELDFHRKFRLWLQLCEVSIKYAAIVGLSGYLLARDKSDAVNQQLIASFKRPSLGSWCTLLERLLNESPGFGKLLHPLTVQDVLKSRRDYLDDSAGKVNLNQMLSAIVSLRNSSTGHGALQTQYEYKQIVDREESRLYSFFERLEFLAVNNSFLVLTSEYDEFGEGDRYKIRIFKGLQISDDDLDTSLRLSEGQKSCMVRYIYFQNTATNTIANLYPFLSYMFCDECRREQFFFYNGSKGGDKTEYLSYACGHSVERDYGAHIRKRFLAAGIDWDDTAEK